MTKNPIFSNLLDRDNSFTIHERNLQLLATFSEKVHTYNLRNNTHLKSWNAKTVKYGTETIRLINET